MEGKKERDALFDNARAVLIFLVIMGHLLSDHLSGASKMAGPRLLKEIYFAINMFHMPAFVFITGYFSKNTEKGREGAVKNFLMPYLVCNTLFALISYLCLGKILKFTDGYKVFSPQFGMWFFLACFIWKLLAKDIDRLRGGVPLCLALGLLLPVLPGFDTTFTIGRVVGFLVFFVAGLKCRPEWIEKLRMIPAWIGGVVLALGAVISGWLAQDGWMKQETLYVRKSYVDEKKLDYLLMRVVFYLLASVMTLAFLVLMTRKRCFLTEIGQNTLTVYVLHLFLIDRFRDLELFMDQHYLYLILSIPLAAALTWLLSRGCVRRCYDKVMGIVYGICFRE